MPTNGLRRLSELGDQLEAYARAVDFEAFRADMEKALPIPAAPRAGGLLTSGADAEDIGDPGGQRAIGRAGVVPDPATGRPSCASCAWDFRTACLSRARSDCSGSG